MSTHSPHRPHRPPPTHRAITAWALVATTLAACAGDDSATEVGESTVATTVDGAAVMVGSDSTDGSAAATVVDPVAVEYAGLTWSVKDSRFVTEDDDGEPHAQLHVDLLVENTNPFGMRWPLQVVALRRADGTPLELDGQVGSNGSRLEIPARDRVRTTLAFEVEEPFDVSELSLTIAETDRIPAMASFASGAVDTEPYPIDVTVDGTTKPLPLMYTTLRATDAIHRGDDHARLVALTAAVTVDAPGVRAGTGRRLVVVDLRMDVEATSSAAMHLVTDHYRLRVGSVASAPVALIEHVDEGPRRIPTVEPGASEEFTVVFDVPADASGDAALVVITDEGYDQDEIPLPLPALPPCCGED